MGIFDRFISKKSGASATANQNATAFFEWLSKQKTPTGKAIRSEDINNYLSVLLTAPYELNLPAIVKEIDIYSSSDPKMLIKSIREARNFQKIDKHYKFTLAKALSYFEQFINESKLPDGVKVVPKKAEILNESLALSNDTNIVSEFEKWLSKRMKHIVAVKETTKTLYIAPTELSLSSIVDRKVFRRTTPYEVQDIISRFRQAKNFNRIDSIYNNQLSFGLEFYKEFITERSEHISISKAAVEVALPEPVIETPKVTETAIPTANVPVIEKSAKTETKRISSTERATQFALWLQDKKGIQQRQAEQVQRALYSKPLLLNLTLSVTERKVFECEDSTELQELVSKFSQAKNWDTVADNSSKLFKRCLSAYDDYLRDINKSQNVPELSFVKPKTASKTPTKSYTDIPTEPDFIPAYLTPPLIQKRDDPLINELKPILEERFKNGIYYEKPVDLNKLKRYYTEAKGSEIPDSKDLSNIIKRCGIEVGDKIYFVTDESKRELEDVIDNILQQGFRYVDYTAFRGVQYELCERLYIYDDNVLKHILSKIRPKLNYTTTAFTVTTSDRIVDELEHIFTDNYVLSLDEMYEMLPYIEHDSIYASLNRVSQFINNSTGSFTHIDKIYLDETECKTIAVYVRKEVTEHGFCNLRNLEMPVSNELSGGISDSAIKKKFYIAYLEKDFEESSLLITKNGANKKDIFKNIMESRDRITYEEIRQLQEDVLGERTNNLYVFYAKEFLVRVSEELYLKDLEFDTERADFAIQQFMSSDCVELREITSFTSFPDVGYPWNEYLLESYVRRFSSIFELDGKSTVRVKKDVRIHA